MAQLSLERPVETAVLLSLVGVRSILANQWPTFLQDNALRASVLWESEWARPSPPREPAGGVPGQPEDVSFLDLLTAGRPIGRAAHLLRQTGAGDTNNHGNGSCSTSPLILCHAGPPPGLCPRPSSLPVSLQPHSPVSLPAAPQPRSPAG